MSEYKEVEVAGEDKCIKLS